MEILSLIDLPAALPLGVLTGQYGATRVLDDLNAQWRNSGSGVIFGQDTYGERFKQFSSMVSAQVAAVSDAAIKTIEAVTCPNKMQEIESIEELKTVPACMMLPILTMPEVRPLFESGQLDGWGIKPEDLPTEDVYGRLISNGSFDTGAEDYDREAPVTWVFKTGDPVLTHEELEKIRTTRGFISRFLEEQMGPDGDRIDLTDIPNRMGKLRNLKPVQKKD